MLEIFYNEIIKEAKDGRIKCENDFIYNIIFNTKINNKLLYYSDNSNLFVPTLNIKNKDLFDKLLLLYVKNAQKFYEINDIKTIMTLLWSNATVNDFNNPIFYLKKRIAFFEDKVLINNFKNINLYSLKLLSNIDIFFTKNKIQSETPYAINIRLKFDKENFYILPKIYLGIFNDKAYIYAIQNDKNTNLENSDYQKYIKRKLYQVNKGLDVKNDNENIYGVGNLKDISVSFLLAINITIGILKCLKIKTIEIPSILIERYNSKEIMYSYLVDNCKINDNDYNNFQESHNILQSNLTDKFLRLFRRMEFHHTGINIVQYPFEENDAMVLKIDDENICNNELLDETFNLYMKNKIENKNKKK